MTVEGGAPREVAPRVRAGVARIVLVGFMGAGKSTVGPILARALDWDFVDLDDEVARREGSHPAEIIRRRGIERFRALESVAARELLRRERVVIAMGGGWAAQPGHMASLKPDSPSVWLRVDPVTALARIRGSSTPRPLLEGPDPHGAAVALLRRRVGHYGRSVITIETDGRSPEEVAWEILRHPSMTKSDREECQ
ncbi:MAG: shikimate kinase [Gemmatimonadetes bacterium]|nr:shikimate kinase [Gemmatimonadota bacterium]MYA65493.1 shikimate kinase [Gemmatimonadota bacterium]MYB99470.1 shikimate kinase [Gemmatimonadota bacterium]MYH52057.1 shikimate kinase [Gemmatimonadota bacterium]MYK65677.1 shikimate kinase [Gemmatimonadota bacterium]